MLSGGQDMRGGRGAEREDGECKEGEGKLKKSQTNWLLGWERGETAGQPSSEPAAVQSFDGVTPACR